MAEKKMIRKVISKKTIAVEVSPENVTEKPVKAEEVKEGKSKKFCLFCQSKTIPSYLDTNVLRRYISDRAKITPRAKNGLCSKHQRGVAKEIKYARHLSLLPFTPKI